MLTTSLLPEIFLGTLFTALLFCGIAEFRREKRGRLLLCFLLRAGAVIALYLMLTGNGSLQWEKTRAQHSCILLRDVSDSMKIQGRTLQREFDAVYAETRNALRTLENAQITELVFASETAPAETKEKLPGTSTALGNVLASLAHRYSNAQIFLLSDGRSNQGTHPAAAAAFLKNLGFTLHVLLPGRAAEEIPPTLAISSVSCPDSFRAGQEKIFRAALLVSGVPEGKKATLRAELRVDGKRIGQIREKADGPLPDVQFKPEEANIPGGGWHELEIRAALEIPGSEEVTALYRDVFEVPSENTAMLLWNRMDPELNALLPLLRERYNPFRFAYVSRFAKQPVKEQEKQIDSLRLLMLGPVTPDTLAAEVKKTTARKLREKSLTLLFLSPRVLNAWRRDPEIGNFVPAANTAFTRLPDGTRYRFTENGTVRSLPFASLWRMTPKASAAPKVLPGDWNGIPPLLLSGGNVTAFATADTWRWRIAPDRSLALAFVPFWKQMLSACDNFDASNLRLTIARADPLLSDDLYRFTVEDYAKQTAGTDLCLLRRAPGGKEMQTLLRFAPAKNRVTSAQLRITGPGIHWFRAEDAKTHRRTGPIPLVIRGNEAETRFRTPDLALLRKLAELGGGELCGRDAIRSTIGKIAARTKETAFRTRRTHHEGAPGFRFACAVLALLLLSTEWLLRKKETHHAEP